MSEQQEDLQVTKLEGIGSVTGKKLKDIGVETIKDLATWDGHTLAQKANISLDTATKYIDLSHSKLIEIQQMRPQFVTGEQHLELTGQIKRITTGSSMLDELLGGGVRTECITEFFGQFGSGKSQLCFTLCVTAQQQELGNVIYVDTEGTFSSTRVQEIAVARNLDPTAVLRNIMICSIKNSAQLENVISDMSRHVREHSAKLVIIDSIIALHRAEFRARGALADRQQRIGEILHKLLRVAEVQKIAVVVTNQVVTSPDQLFGDPNKPTGGNVLGHTMTYRVYLRKAGKKRFARMYDSPEHPEFERLFTVDERGTVDVEPE